MKKELEKTNYVVVLDYEDGLYLDEAYLLGWDSRYDWYADDICGDEIMTKAGNVKKNYFGAINVGRMVSAYVGNTINDCKAYAIDARKEGYNCTVCCITKDEDGDWLLIPAEV